MKSVGKQLEEARLAKGWTPEMAARETKIKVDRLRDLEADDYTHFSSPAYARGFVRTYGRFMGLDEYKLLRQLDHKLPDDDTPTLVTDSGVAYLPENSLPPRVAHRNLTGLYIVFGLGCAVSLIIVFILFEAYRVGELPRYFSETAATDDSSKAPDGTGTNATPPAEADAAPQALPVDPIDTSHAPKAEPVDLSAAASPPPDSTPVTDVPFKAVKALPVNPEELAAAPSAASSANVPVDPVKALPVDPSPMAQATPPPMSAAPAANAAPPATVSTDTKTPPRALPVDLSELNPPAPVTTANPAPPAQSTPPATVPAPPANVTKPLILTASEDSYVRVTSLDKPDKPLYAAVLHTGQSVGFDGRKFSIDIGIPNAVDIRLDGINQGPHSHHDAPETFIVEAPTP